MPPLNRDVRRPGVKSDETLILFAGLPATGKSSFCRYLARAYGFAHYDMECWPKGWPVPDLHPIWESSRQAFVARLRQLHGHVALDWGFPPDARPLVMELLSCGVKLVWFAGDPEHTRTLYQARGGLPMEAFDRQMRETAEAGLPAGLDAEIVNTLTASGSLKPMAEIFAEVFPVA